MLTLDIAGLPATEIENAVADYCARWGTVNRVKVHLPSRQIEYAFALVEMSSVEEADNVLVEVGDSEFISAIVIWLEQAEKKHLPAALRRVTSIESGPAKRKPAAVASGLYNIKTVASVKPVPEGQINILLVEDDPADVRMTREALRVSGIPHNLHVVEDGLEAISFLYRTRQFDGVPEPDIIVLDLNIPKLNGHTVLSEIKCNDRLKRIPVVVLTCSRSARDMQKSRMMKADRFMTKATGLEAFTEQIKSIAAMAMH